MKLIAFLALSFVFISGIAHSSDSRMELNDIHCLHYRNINHDPSLSVSFTYKEENNDFVKVVIKERFTSSYTHDTRWVEIYKNDEQVASSDKDFNLGVDDFSMEIERPVPAWNQSTKNNATLDLGNGKTLKLRCEKR